MRSIWDGSPGRAAPLRTVDGILFSLVMAAMGASSAGEIAATGDSQPAGEHWNQATWTGGQWSDGLAPSAGKAYRTANVVIRTVNSSSSTFGGDTLRLETGGGLFLKQSYNNTATVNLILDGGTLYSTNSTTGTGLQFVSGNVQVLSNSSVGLGGTNRRRISIRNGALSGSGNITIDGGDEIEDLLQLESTLTSTHTGNWTVNGGRLITYRDDQIGDTKIVTLNGAAAYLDIRSAQQIGSLVGSGTVRTGVAGTYTLFTGGDNSSTTFSGIIQNGSGTLVLVKEGTGTFILSGANTYSGATTVSAGTLQIGDGGTAGTLGSGDVTNNGALVFNRSDTLTVNNTDRKFDFPMKVA